MDLGDEFVGREMAVVVCSLGFDESDGCRRARVAGFMGGRSRLKEVAYRRPSSTADYERESES